MRSSWISNAAAAPAELHRVLAVMRALTSALELVDHQEQPTEEILTELLGDA